MHVEFGFDIVLMLSAIHFKNTVNILRKTHNLLRFRRRVDWSSCSTNIFFNQHNLFMLYMECNYRMPVMGYHITVNFVILRYSFCRHWFDSLRIVHGISKPTNFHWTVAVKSCSYLISLNYPFKRIVFE